MAMREWSYGDRVVHSGKPEWGVGLVTGASGTTHEGRPCQRVVVRFERAGVKTLSTAFAELKPASETPALVAAERAEAEQAQRNGHAVESPEAVAALGSRAGEAGWLEKAGSPTAVEVMTRLPEATTDPFTPLTARFKATTDLFRFTDSGGSLLDWAAAQSGLKDPLSRFSRHELEQLFRRFCFVRDEHLKRVVLDMKKQDAAALQQLLRAAPAPVQQALRRLDVGR